ncbi:MAG: YadA-like family protein [Stenotrophomonas maltophilia]
MSARAGWYSVELGPGANASSSSTVAIGNGSQATSFSAVAVGHGSVASGAESIAVGRGANATTSDAAAIGYRASAKGIGSTAVGRDASASAIQSSAFGYGAKTDGRWSLALGNGSHAVADRSVAMGMSSKATGANALALGRYTQSVGESDIAIGSYAKTLGAGAGIARVAIGEGAAAGTEGYTGAVALGGRSKAEFDGVSIGYNSKASKTGAVALGVHSIADEANTVSVGNSTTKRRIVNLADARLTSSSTDAVTGKQLYATEQKIGSLNGMLKAGSHTDSFVIGTGSVSASANTVSVGSASKKRRIQYLADGVIGSGSTDAITGSQLHATNTKVAAVEKTANTAKTDLVAVREIAQKAANRIDATTLALGKGATAENGSYGISTALGNNAKAYNGRSVALGDDARAGVDADGNKVANQNAGVSVGAGTRSANGAVATGFRANASGNFSIAVGGDAKAESEHATAVGYLSKASASQATALGRGSEATAQYATALGNLAKATTTSAVALGDRAQAKHDNAVALGAGSVTASSDSVSVGSSSKKRRIQYIADGVVGAGSTDAITGNQLHATNQAVTKAQAAADGATTTANAAKVESGQALADTGVLKGLVGQVAVNGNIRVGEKNSGTVLDVRNSANANRKLTGVADGAVGASSYEAVNGRQLNATNDKVAAVEAIAKAAGTEAAVAKTDAVTALAETAALGGLVAQVSATGNVRLGEKNSGTTLDVRNSANANRKISGVADGSIDASSTEAVSGRQLHSTNSRISDLESANHYVSVGVDSFSERAEAALLGVAIGDSAKAGAEGGTALGAFATALGKNSVAVGRGAGVAGGASDGFAMGAGAQVHANNGVAIGAGAVVGNSAVGSMALGADSAADESGTASFGNATTQRRLTNIARGTADHNATTVSQLKDSLATLGGGAGMDGNGNLIAPTYTVQGGTQNTVEDALTALDGAVITAGRRADKVEGQLSSIFQDSPSARADGLSQIALNGVNGMVLTNLADGRVAPGSRDAVTGNQLYAAEQKISQNRNDLDAMRKEREMGQQAMRGLDASVIDYGGALLTGVADGSISADSRDVVTGRQLFGVSDRVSNIEHQGRFLKINTDELSEDAFAGFLGVAIGDSAMTGGDGGTALGAYARALGDGSVALGRGSGVSADAPDGFAVGVGSRVHSAQGIAIGLGSVVESGAAGSLALGAGSAATEVGVVSFGNPNMKRRLVNIANGTANHNAATVGQLRGALSALGGEVDANGNIVGPRFNVQGQAQSTLNGALEALDAAVVTNTSRVDKVETQLRSVFQDAPTVRADGVNQLTLAGANGMVISNVANGLIAAGSRDAVNGGQLHSMQQQLNGRMDGLEQRIDDAPAPRALASSSVPKPQTEEAPVVPEGKDSQQVASVGEGDKPTPQPKAKQDDTPKPQVDTAELEKMLARANEYTDGAISNVERRLDKMDKRFNRMAAMSSAQSAMAMNTAGLATYNRLGAGVGYSEGESAMAVGYQRVLNEKGSATFSLNGAFTNSGERSMGVGVGIGW